MLAAAFRGDLTKDWREKNPEVEPATELLKRIRVERRKKWEENELAKMRAKGKVPSDDRWKEKYKEPEGVDESELPELPEGWCWASLSSIADIQLGQRRAPEYVGEAEFPYVRAANITWRGLDLSDVKTMGFAAPDVLFLQKGDVLLSEASGSPTEVGKPALWNDEIPRCCFQATVLRIRAYSHHVAGAWLHAVFLADVLGGKFAAMAPGVGILHLTAERMRGWPIPIAPMGEQMALSASIADAMERSFGLENLLDTMRRPSELDAAILSKAFRGELVPQDPNDEPASILLERIRKERAARETEGKGKKKRARARIHRR